MMIMTMTNNDEDDEGYDKWTDDDDLDDVYSCAS